MELPPIQKVFTMRKRITERKITERITEVKYFLVKGTTMTLCIITLENGFSVSGQSACVDTKLFNKEIGQSLAYKNAFEQLWRLEAYLMAEERWRAAIRADALSGYRVLTYDKEVGKT